MTAAIREVSLFFVFFFLFCFGCRELIHTGKWLQIVAVLFLKLPCKLRILYN